MCLLNAPDTFHEGNVTEYSIYNIMETVYKKTCDKVVVTFVFDTRTNRKNAWKVGINRPCISRRNNFELGSNGCMIAK